MASSNSEEEPLGLNLTAEIVEEFDILGIPLKQ